MVKSKWLLSGANLEIRNGEGGCLGVKGRSPLPTEANGGLGAKLPADGGMGAQPPILKIFGFFCNDNLILGLFLMKKNNAFKTWHKNWQCKHD